MYEDFRQIFWTFVSFILVLGVVIGGLVAGLVIWMLG